MADARTPILATERDRRRRLIRSAIDRAFRVELALQSLAVDIDDHVVTPLEHELEQMRTEVLYP